MSVLVSDLAMLVLGSPLSLLLVRDRTAVRDKTGEKIEHERAEQSRAEQRASRTGTAEPPHGHSGTEALLGAVVARVFRHRHRRLRAKFGGGPLK